MIRTPGIGRAASLINRGLPRRLSPYLLAGVVTLASILGLLARPATGAPGEHADYVVIAGAAGLRWDDVSPTATPTLWAMAKRGSIGALSVRSAHSPTCPADGWLTLGAGNYAQWRRAVTEGGCPALSPELQNPDGIGAYLPELETSVAEANRAVPNTVQPGALAEAVRCTTAVGVGAAIAAARPFGRVDRYADALPADPRPLLSECVLSIVDLGTISGSDPVARQAQARQADATLARVLAARPERSLVMVAGLSDTNFTSRLHVAIADGPGYASGWLTSSSTSRPGYLELTDLAPTALAALDRPSPIKLFSGQPADSIAGRPTDLSSAVAQLSDADREASAQRRVTGRFFGILTVVELLLIALAVPVLRRARRYGRRPGGSRLPRRVLRGAEVLLVAAALTVPAALIADAVPWWRSARSGLLFGAATVLVVAVLTAIVELGRWRRGVLGPLGIVGGLVAVIVGVDVLTGARLQLNGVAGYSALEGSRYAGLGTIGLGVFIAGTLLVAGALAQAVPRWLGRRWRPVVVAVVGGLGVVIVGSPYLGSDAGGAVALTAGVCVAAAISTGGFLTFARLAWAAITGITVTTGFALLDLRNPGEDRGNLGRFLTDARNGTGNLAVHRTSVANVVTVISSPLTLLVLGAAIMTMFVLLRPWGGLKRVFGIHPAVRAGLVGVAVASIPAGFLDGAGLNVAGAAAATVLPLTILIALRVLDRADERSVAIPAIDPPHLPEPADLDRFATPSPRWVPRLRAALIRRPRPPAAGPAAARSAPEPEPVALPNLLPVAPGPPPGAHDLLPVPTPPVAGVPVPGLAVPDDAVAQPGGSAVESGRVGRNGRSPAGGDLPDDAVAQPGGSAVESGRVGRNGRSPAGGGPEAGDGSPPGTAPASAAPASRPAAGTRPPAGGAGDTPD